MNRGVAPGGWMGIAPLLNLVAALAHAESLPAGRFAESSEPPFAEVELRPDPSGGVDGRLVLRDQRHDGMHTVLDAALEIDLAPKPGTMALRPSDGSAVRTYERVDAGERAFRFERAPLSADGSHREREAWSFAFEGADRLVLFRETYRCHPDGLRCSPPVPSSYVLERKGKP